MPTPATVGPGAMPGEIARLDPPFEMAQLIRPKFPPLSVDIGSQGAQPGLNEPVTKVIQECIDQVAASGGGTVVIPSGKWLTGRILLKSGVNLHLTDGAELHFSGRIEDYLPVVFTRHEGLEIMGLGGLIYAHQQSKIAVTGRGTLVGPEEGPVREALPGLSDKMVDHNLPVDKRCVGWSRRPSFFSTIFCYACRLPGCADRGSNSAKRSDVEHCAHLLRAGDCSWCNSR